MKAGFLNVNSLRPRIEKLRLYVSENPNYHFFGIAESWLGPVVDDTLIRIEGYSVLRQDRNVNGGGVALYVRNDFQITLLKGSRIEQPGKPGIPEYLFCEVRQGISSPILIGVIYRPPHVAMQKDTDLFPVLQDLSGNYSHKFILGDMNADLSAADVDADAITVRHLAKELSLQIVPHGPTHHKTENTHTWIDLILIDDNGEILDYVIECSPSFGKHAIIDVAINFFVPAPVTDSFSYRDYNNICPTALNELLSCCD